MPGEQFTLADLPDMPALLRALVVQVPPGRVTTCGGLAAALGNPIAAGWVGHFLLHHEHDAVCLCHRVDVAFAEQLVRQLLAGRRLPEPIYWADRLSRAAVRESGGTP